MRIVLVNAPFLPDSLGGAEMHTYEMADRLKARGHEVMVICSRAGIAGKFDVIFTEYEGIPLVRMEIPDDGQSLWSLRRDVGDWAQGWFAEWKPDVLHVGIFWGLLGVAEVAHRRGIPVTFICHGYDFFCRQISLMHPNGRVCDGQAGGLKCMACISQPWSWAERVRSLANYSWRWMLSAEDESVRPLEKVYRELREVLERGRWIGAAASAIVAPSRFMQRMLVQNDFPKEKIHFISNGVEVARFQTAGGGLSLPGSGKPLRFLYAGRLTSSKGVDVMLEAFHGISRAMAAELRIHGDMEDPLYRNEVEVWRQRYEGDSRIIFGGRVGGMDLVRAYHEADVVLMPTRCAENCSLVILEAQAAGRSVIASDVGGVSERVVDGVCGRLVPPGNVVALRAAMEDVLQNPEQLVRWEQSITPVPTLDANTAALEAVLRDALG